MGARKRLKAEARKEANKQSYFASLRNCPTSPRKMRLVADLIKGKDVYTALNILRMSPKEASNRLEKLVKSAIHNYEAKSGNRAEDSNVFISQIMVDGGFQLKRLRPAPQGRAYRVRKRSNHVTVILNERENNVTETETKN